MTTVINDTDAKRNIAFHVDRLLTEQKRSRYWLAQNTGEWQSRISDICNARTLCTAGVLARVADALDVSVDELLKPIPKKSIKSA